MRTGPCDAPDLHLRRQGADAIYTPRGLKTVERLAGVGLCVQGHLGLVPRLSTRVGGLRIIGTVIECPLHQGRFDITTGKALRAPVRIDLGTYPVKVEGGIIFIKIQEI